MSNQLLQQIKNKLPYKDIPQQTEKRLKIWSSFDVNGNGYISLAQADKGIRDVIRLPQLFALKPVIIRAFNAAKNKLPSKKSYGDDYVSKAEFKYLLLYIRQYYQYWIAFDSIDSSKDRRITNDEFKYAVPILKKWGIEVNDPNKAFKEIDANHGGYILFDEFCRWAVQKGMDISA